MTDQTIVEIKVLNKNGVLLCDMFDGIAYKFEPDMPVKLPLAAANNIFGVQFPDDAATCQSDEFRAQIWEHLQRRWGWNTYDEVKYKIAKKMFTNLIMTPVVLQLVEKEAVEVDLAEPRPERALAKSGKFKPRADEAGEPSEEEVA